MEKSCRCRADILQPIALEIAVANYDKVFHKDAEADCLLNAIEPDDHAVEYLKSARLKIKKSLREGLRAATEAHFGPGGGVTPRFFTQGSWAYNTCNAPCQGGQEMDLDVGVYLPMENWRDEDIRPSEAAIVYFKMVETCLRPLARDEGWDFDNKPNCVRLKVNNQIAAHVDVPLYVAPKKEFDQIKESLESIAANRSLTKAYDALADQDWSELKHIALATRDDGWRLSDPRKVADYFKEAFSRENGRQLRRVCRYLKAARDHHFFKGGPSSVLLMVCASWDWQNAPARDDLALLHVLEKLGNRLNSEVVEPKISENEDLNRVPEEDRVDVRNWADRLHRLVKKAVENRRADEAPADLKMLGSYFDRRIPQDASLIIWTPGVEEIMSTPAQIQSQPVNREVTSG